MIFFLVGPQKSGKTTAVRELMPNLFHVHCIPEANDNDWPDRLFFANEQVKDFADWNKLMSFCKANQHKRTIVVEVSSEKELPNALHPLFSYSILTCKVLQ